jgi:hypothetical protein
MNKSGLPPCKGRHLSGTTIINLRIGTKKIFNIKSGVVLPIMITNIGNRHRNIIPIKIIIIYSRIKMLRGRHRFLSPFTPLLLLHTLLTLSLRRERLEGHLLHISFRRERHLLHIIWFTDRNNRRNFGGFFLSINKIETSISPVIAWQNIMFCKIL